MRVEATRRGFYVKLRDPGQEFDVPEDAFSAKWMKRVGVETEPVETPAPVPQATEPEAAPIVTEAEATQVAEPAPPRRRGRPPKPKADSE